MYSKIHFAKKFKNRMLVLAVLTGFLITISMPLTYFMLTLSNEGRITQTRSDDLALRLQDTIKDNPRLWKYNIQKFIKVLAEYNNLGISVISILDNGFSDIYKENVSKTSLFEQTRRSKIIYNNQIFGYVEISTKTDKLVSHSLMLLTAFLLLGILVGTILYRFPTRIVIGAEDEIAAAFEKLNTLSYFDHLTSLPNRTMFNEKLMNILQNAQQNKKKVAVMFLDLDRFKVINDTMGHSSGDAVLQAVATRLASCMRNNDVLARHSGDEFTVIISDIENFNVAAKIAQKLLNTFNEPFLINNHKLYISSSIGISIYPTNSKNADCLVKYADIAMYKAKEQGNNKFKFYASDFSPIGDQKFELENDLRNALKNNEFILHYQPIISIMTRRIEGFEALVRWNHPIAGIIPPDKFIPLAEETGLINQIGQWVLYEACAQNQAWLEKGLFPKYISVNISLRQFKQPDLIHNIKKVLQDTGLNAKYLQLEITESISMFDEERTIAILNVLKTLGVKIAIDDFGTGYSSLNYLKNFPISVLKIDKSFIENMLENPPDAAAIKFIIQMAHSLNLNVVAEGVETEEQLTFLRKNYCNDMQGFLYSKALPPHEIESLLKEEEDILIQPGKNRFPILVQNI